MIGTNAADKKDLEPGDEIWLNKDFNPNNSKPLTVPTTFRKSGGDDVNSEQNLKQHRNMVLDANITRIMKVHLY